MGERGLKLSEPMPATRHSSSFYKDASIYVLDEATSALDNYTEQEVMKSFHNIANNITIFMIAHRLSTLANCDYVMRLDKGRLVDFDKPDRLFT